MEPLSKSDIAHPKTATGIPRPSKGSKPPFMTHMMPQPQLHSPIMMCLMEPPLLLLLPASLQALWEETASLAATVQ